MRIEQRIRRAISKKIEPVVTVGLVTTTLLAPGESQNVFSQGTISQSQNQETARILLPSGTVFQEASQQSTANIIQIGNRRYNTVLQIPTPIPAQEQSPNLPQQEVQPEPSTVQPDVSTQPSEPHPQTPETPTVNTESQAFREGAPAQPQLEAPLSVEQRIQLEFRQVHERLGIPIPPFEPIVINEGDLVVYSFVDKDPNTQPVVGVILNGNHRPTVEVIVANGKKKDDRRVEYFFGAINGYFIIDEQKIPVAEKANKHTPEANPYSRYRYFGYEILDKVIRGYYALSSDAPIENPEFLQWITESQLQWHILSNIVTNRNGRSSGGLPGWQIATLPTGVFYVVKQNPQTP